MGAVRNRPAAQAHRPVRMCRGVRQDATQCVPAWRLRLMPRYGSPVGRLADGVREPKVFP